MPDIRHRQQLLAASLAHLLTLDLPVAYWVIYHVGGSVAGMVASQEDVTTWAAVISDGAVTVIPYSDGAGTFEAHGIGPYASFRVWSPLTAEQMLVLSAAATVAKASDLTAAQS
ncbi:hypothetical protein [Nonomuraea dietziae]|uniref:hypothetical protein n=1 Tax=Nonomuraea dietziae TaxID=65515 RepID=UPI003420E0EF